VGLAVKYPYVSGARATIRARWWRWSTRSTAATGRSWRPADGICDDLVESFTIKLPRCARAARGRGARLGQRRQRRARRPHHQAPGRMTAPADDTVGLPPAPEVVQIEVGLLQNFCEILYCPETRAAAIVDPAWEVDTLLREAKRLD
jgi:hypothetical protein